jgi:Zn-dependent M28 family amino/carboxypeptidase
VRFGFWGSEEAVLEVDEICRQPDRDQLNDIALYLNFDMLGSPNAGFFTYDWRPVGSGQPQRSSQYRARRLGGLERTLAGYLNLADPARRHAAG